MTECSTVVEHEAVSSVLSSASGRKTEGKYIDMFRGKMNRSEVKGGYIR